MTKSLSKALSVGAAILMVGALAACGGDSTSSRNRNSALDAVACLDGSAGTLTSENDLKLTACATATKWATVSSDGTDGEQKDIVDGAISLPVIGRGPVTVKTFNAAGEVVATDLVKPNGSRGGIVYRIDQSGDKPVYYEAAPIGWAGSVIDPSIDRTEFAKYLEIINTATGGNDWRLGSLDEMNYIAENAELSNTLGLYGGDWTTMYWTSTQLWGWYDNDIVRPANAQFGYAHVWANIDLWRSGNHIRPIRSFTAGTEAPVVVTPPEETSTTIAEDTTTTVAPVPTTVPLDSESQLAVDILTPVGQVVDVPATETTVSVTPAVIDEWLSGGTNTEFEKLEYSFDGINFSPISVDANTDVTIPVTAKSVKVRYTLKSGVTSEVTKTLKRSGDAEVTTTTMTPDSTVAPTPADDVVDVTETSNASEPTSESSSNTIWIAAGAVLLLAAAGGAIQLRRKKK